MPTPAIRMTAANKVTSWIVLVPSFAHKNRTAALTAIVAATTAIPPPCGVGILCEERAFGRARAWRSSNGRSAIIDKALIAAAMAMMMPAHGTKEAISSLFIDAIVEWVLFRRTI